MDLAGIKEKSQKNANGQNSFKIKNKKLQSPAKKKDAEEGEIIFKNTEKVGGWNYGNKSNSRDSKADVQFDLTSRI